LFSRGYPATLRHRAKPLGPSILYTVSGASRFRLMPTTLDLRTESLRYTAIFARPPFPLWGQGAQIVGGLYDALLPYNVTLRNIQLSGSVPTAADTMATVTVGSTVLKFSFEKIEVTFTGFSEQEFQGIPKFIETATAWLEKDFPFSSHEAIYFSHCSLEGMATDDFLKTVIRPLQSAGVEQGGGASFYRAVPEKRWTTKLTLDRSVSIPGGLFLGLTIGIANAKVNYFSLLTEGREYLVGMLSELGLALPLSETK
jgi:hypothetical protein